MQPRHHHGSLQHILPQTTKVRRSQCSSGITNFPTITTQPQFQPPLRHHLRLHVAFQGFRTEDPPPDYQEEEAAYSVALEEEEAIIKAETFVVDAVMAEA